MNLIRAFISMMALVLAGHTQAQNLPSYHDFATRPTLSSPALSPDGKYLAVSYHDNEGGTDRYQLAVLALPQLTPVSRLNMPQFYLPAGITWVSNERLVISMAYQSGTREAPSLTGEIISLDYDGSKKETLYSMRAATGSAQLKNKLPMGFAQTVGVPDALDGNVYIQIMQGGRRWEDGKSMIFEVNTRNSSNRQLAEINRGGMRFLVHGGTVRYAYGEDDDMKTAVFYRDSVGEEWKQLTSANIGTRFIPLRFAPDGQHIYAIHSATGEPDALVLAKLDGSVEKTLASNPFSEINDIFWTPLPRTPYAVVFRGGRPQVQYLEKTRYGQIHAALAKQLPDHFVDFVSMTPNGDQLLIHSVSDRDPGNYALFDTNAMKATPLYATMPWINAGAMSPRNPIRFTTSDGLELDGYLTMPRTSSNHNIPMVVIPHGGPIGPYDNWEYDPDSQFLASRGYAVLQINYRGSGDRGFGFQRAGYKQFADRIQQDIIEGTRWAIQQGYADGNRVCIYGASFGGYSALMAPIRAPDLFKCSINYVGISDYQIWFDRADTRRSQGGRNYFEQAIGTDKATVREVSPIYHLDRFNIPVFIVHGEDDKRVPIKNATDLRAALDRAGKPYEWMVKPKEGHGFYSEANREELYQRMEAFLGKYIGPTAVTGSP